MPKCSASLTGQVELHQIEKNGEAIAFDEWFIELLVQSNGLAIDTGNNPAGRLSRRHRRSSLRGG